MDAEVFRLWAKLMHGQSSALYENVMIAAMAKVHNLIGVTRNTRDFERFNLPLFNPFEYVNFFKSNFYHGPIQKQ